MTDHSDGAAGNEARTSNGARAASATGLLSRPIAAVANKNVWQARQQARVEAEEREKARQREEQERERRNNNEARVAHKQQTQQHAPSPWNKTHTGPGVMVQSPPMHHHQRTQAWQHPMQQSHARSSHHPPHHPHQYHHQPQSVQSAVSFTSRLHHYFHQVLLPSIRPVQWEVDTIEMGRRTIEGLIQSICPGGRLVPFGSMVNRLALRNSDLDLCLVLNDHPEHPQHRTPRQILESIGKKLRKEFPILYIQYKTHARIPIIKIYTRRQVINGPNLIWNKFIADISVGNVLAIYNTRLVKAYTAVDERFKHLVLFLKLWTSRRKINEAFHGTLSSYGWTILAIHFLMHGIQPPILPNLQDIERPAEIHETDLVDGYDTYFFNDLLRMSQYFRISNTSSFGELIRDFFVYYTDKFNYEEDVVSIRRSWQEGAGQSGTMKKEEKGWDEDRERDHNYICIEDPFKTDYNVGRVVQRKGYDLIRLEIQRAKDILLDSENTQQYVGHCINHLLEPGEGMVRVRLQNNTNGNVDGVGNMHPNGGIRPQAPAGLGAIEVLEEKLRAIDFPPLA